MVAPYFKKSGGEPNKKSGDRKTRRKKTAWRATAAMGEPGSPGGGMGKAADTRRWRKFVD